MVLGQNMKLKCCWTSVLGFHSNSFHKILSSCCAHSLSDAQWVCPPPWRIQWLITKSFILIWTWCDEYCLGDIRTLWVFQLFDSHNILAWTMCGAQDSTHQQFWAGEQASTLQSATDVAGQSRALKVYSQLSSVSLVCFMHRQPVLATHSIWPGFQERKQTNP